MKILLIEDHPASEVRQLRSANLALAAIEKDSLRSVYTTGGSGDLSLLEQAQRISADERREIAGEWIAKHGLLTGEFIQLIYPVSLDLIGVDVPVLYERSLWVLRRTVLRSSRAHPDGPGRRFADRVMGSLKAQFTELTRTRAVFMTENLLRQMELRGEKKALWLLEGRSIEPVEEYLKERNISYEVTRTTFGADEESRYETALGLEAMPSGGAEGARKLGRIPDDLRGSLGLRALKERSVIDLLNDRKPGLWAFGERMGLDAMENLDLLFRSLGPSSADILKRTDDIPGFTWAETLIPKAHASSAGEPGFFHTPWNEWAVGAIDREADRAKYEAFRVLSEKMESSKRADRSGRTPEIIESYMRTYEDALKQAEAQKLRRKSEFLGSPFLTYWLQRFRNWAEHWTVRYRPDPKATAATLEFIRANRTPGGMPLSYWAPDGYWENVRSPMDAVDSVMERLIVKYSVSIYDAALWQIALSVAGTGSDAELVDAYTGRLASGSSGDLMDIRAYGETFLYGEKKTALPRENGYFFRIIADQYIQQDPLDGSVSLPDFPNMPLLHHEDWKPITGEQAWAAIIGPLQRAHMKHGGRIPRYAPEMKLAESLLPALEAMRSSIGAFYHVPEGTHGKSPFDISNENNASMYAALGIFQQALGGSDAVLERKLEAYREGLRSYFKEYGFDRKDGVFYQGGYFLDGHFLPAKIFAADCQTWGINALTPAWIDGTFGEGTAYRVWENTKDRSGFFDDRGILRGIGFTEGHDIHSVEWTCGAILSVRLLEKYYHESHPEWARILRRDGVEMRRGLEAYRTPAAIGGQAYTYANKRYFIPWGWWANPIPSLASSAWVILIDKGFNPFVLGGGMSI